MWVDAETKFLDVPNKSTFVHQTTLETIDRRPSWCQNFYSAVFAQCAILCALNEPIWLIRKQITHDCAKGSTGSAIADVGVCLAFGGAGLGGGGFDVPELVPEPTAFGTPDVAAFANGSVATAPNGSPNAANEVEFELAKGSPPPNGSPPAVRKNLSYTRNKLHLQKKEQWNNEVCVKQV